MDNPLLRPLLNYREAHIYLFRFGIYSINWPGKAPGECWNYLVWLLFQFLVRRTDGRTERRILYNPERTLETDFNLRQAIRHIHSTETMKGGIEY